MESLNSYKKRKLNPINNVGIKTNSGGLIDYILRNEFLVISLGFIFMIAISVIVSALYQKEPDKRDSLVFRQVFTIILALMFVYIILSFMGETIVIFGETINMGLLLYIAICLFIMFIFV